MGPTVVAIDGPAGAGKSTIARRLAAHLGWAYLDSGAMYRALTWVALERGLSLEEPAALARAAAGLELDVDADGTVRIDAQDATDRIRAHRVDAGVSRVARHAEVREVMVRHQRAFARRHARVVAEGRDIGTVVFPDAALKLYLDADPGERARRRQQELGGADAPSLSAVESAMAERDLRDRTREVAPLREAPDAVRIDTTGMTLDEVLAAVAAAVRSAIRPQTAG